MCFTPSCNIFPRKKVLDVSEMESEFGNDLDFLMARVSCCVEDKSVSDQYVVCLCACVCTSES